VIGVSSLSVSAGVFVKRGERFMKEVKQTKTQLEKRRDEINQQLNKVNEDLQFELERNPEDQAIQLEQDEVSTTMEANLQRELTDIEDKLAVMDDE
jgi:RNA polymerase-binding transcription factor DksA